MDVVLIPTRVATLEIPGLPIVELESEGNSFHEHCARVGRGSGGGAKRWAFSTADKLCYYQSPFRVIGIVVVVDKLM